MNDITKHEWSDEDVKKHEGCNCEDCLCLIVCHEGHDPSYPTLNKSDAIAIAKHFKLIEYENKIMYECIHEVVDSIQKKTSATVVLDMVRDYADKFKGELNG